MLPPCCHLWHSQSVLRIYLSFVRREDINPLLRPLLTRGDDDATRLCNPPVTGRTAGFPSPLHESRPVIGCQIVSGLRFARQSPIQLGTGQHFVDLRRIPHHHYPIQPFRH